MTQIWSMKKEQSDAAKKKPKTSAAQIRVQKGQSSPHLPSSLCGADGDLGETLTDLTELELPSTMTTNFPDPADLLNFTLTIQPDEGVASLSSLRDR